jgi:hypothetical protein
MERPLGPWVYALATLKAIRFPKTGNEIFSPAEYAPISSMNIATKLVAGSEAVGILDELRAQYPSTGIYPFMIGEEEDWERVKESVEFRKPDFSEIIRASFDVNLGAWLGERRKEAEEYEFSDEETIGEWPDDDPGGMSLTIHTDIGTGRVKPNVLLGLVPIEHPWHLPAALGYGAWNDCPEPAVHCAFHRSWQERFGAEITGMSADVVECVVARPPTDRAAVMNLAWEQYWYCQDIVEQGCGSISDLAATLLGSKYWYFWWD